MMGVDRWGSGGSGKNATERERRWCGQAGRVGTRKSAIEREGGGRGEGEGEGYTTENKDSQGRESRPPALLYTIASHSVQCPKGLALSARGESGQGFTGCRELTFTVLPSGPRPQ